MTRLTIALVCCAAMMFWGVGPTHAHGHSPHEGGMHGQPSPEVSQTMEQLGRLQQQGQEIEHRLNAIAQRAVEKNPELSTMRDEVVELYQEKLHEYGYPSEERLRELQQMQIKLQTAGDMDTQERQELTQQFNADVATMQQAEQQAQNDPEVQPALQELNAARERAMAKIDEDFPRLQQQHAQIVAQMQALQQELQRHAN